MRIRLATALGALAGLALATPALAADPPVLHAGGDTQISAAVGDRVTIPAELYNTGGPATDVKLRIRATVGAAVDTSYGNCAHTTVDDLVVTDCLFGGPVAAGHMYDVGQGIKATVGDQYYAAAVEYVWFAPGQPGYERPPGDWTQGAGAELTLRDGGPGTPQSEYPFAETTVLITDHSGRDLAAIGATAKGEKGETVRVTVGAENKAATLDAVHSHEPVGAVRFTVPEGTSVTTVPEGCTTTEYDEPSGSWTLPGKPYYHCKLDYYLLAGAKATWTFALRIDKKVTGAEGRVAVVAAGDLMTEDPIEIDKAHGNDKAKVVVNPAAPKPSASASASRPHASTPLAKTGPVAPLGIAGALLAVGGVLLVFGRGRATTRPR